MDDLTLREKLDAIEACDKLIQYYSSLTPKSFRVKFDDEELEDMARGSFEENVNPYRGKISHYMKLKASLMEGLEMDPIMQRVEEVNKGFGK